MKILGWPRRRVEHADTSVEQDDLERRSIEAARNLRHTATNAEQIIEALLAERTQHRRGVPAS